MSGAFGSQSVATHPFLICLAARLDLQRTDALNNSVPNVASTRVECRLILGAVAFPLCVCLNR